MKKSSVILIKDKQKAVIKLQKKFWNRSFLAFTNNRTLFVKVAVHYYGRLAAKQGWRFDSTYDHRDENGEPIPFVFILGSGKVGPPDSQEFPFHNFVYHLPFYG